MGYSRSDDHVLDTMLSTHVPPTRTTLMMQRDARLTARKNQKEKNVSVALALQ